MGKLQAIVNIRKTAWIGGGGEEMAKQSSKRHKTPSRFYTWQIKEGEGVQSRLAS